MNARRRRTVALILALAAARFAFAQDTTVQNLGLAGHSVPVAGDLVMLHLDEGEQGGVDLNGDGDAEDVVLHSFDTRSGALENLGLAGSTSTGWSDERWTAFLVSEADQDSTDLNGDGDTFDSVLHLLDRTTSVITNLGVVARSFYVRVERGLLLFQVLEGAQGAGDLNGDGDVSGFDEVVFAYDALAGELINTGLAVGGDFTSVQLVGSRAFLRVYESLQGATDLNGDGDASGFVLHAFDLESRAATNFALESLNGLALYDFGTLGAASVQEDAASGDLNGDGDTNDNVLHIFDGASGALIDTGQAIEPFAQLVGDRERVAAMVDELAMGQDLNGDGAIDSRDDVPFLYDHRTGTLLNLGLSTTSMAMDFPWLALTVSELRQGALDRNGDGDPNDLVAHVVDLTTGAITNLGLASGALGPAALQGGILTTGVPERGQGGDLNGDGDDLDLVAVHLDLLSGTRLDSAALNEFLAAPESISRAATVLRVPEMAQGADLNGDGDKLDNVVHLALPCAGSATSLGLAVLIKSPSAQVLTASSAVIEVDEASQGVDLNDDGDLLDGVLHLVTFASAAGTIGSLGAGVPASGGIAPRLSGTGCGSVGRVGGVALDDGLGGALAILVGGTTPAEIPLFGGELFVHPFDFVQVFALGGPSGIAGAGEHLAGFPILDPALIGVTVIVQGAVLDPAAPGPVALTDALTVTIDG